MLEVADASAAEGVDATLGFAVTLRPASPDTVTVDYATADATAQAGEDYTAAVGTLTFAPGETAQTIPGGAAGRREGRGRGDLRAAAQRCVCRHPGRRGGGGDDRQQRSAAAGVAGAVRAHGGGPRAGGGGRAAERGGGVAGDHRRPPAEPGGDRGDGCVRSGSVGAGVGRMAAGRAAVGRGAQHGVARAGGEQFLRPVGFGGRPTRARTRKRARAGGRAGRSGAAAPGRASPAPTARCPWTATW